MVAVVWHYWIGLLLALGTVATLLALGVGYLARVSALRYPPKGSSGGRKP